MNPKRKMLKSLITSKDLTFLMEAHNGISARIVEEAGFSGIWASGLSMSSSFGVRDRNELSWSQVADCVEFMTDVTSIPILVDGDTGFGDFNNFGRLVRKLGSKGAAGVCIEDKVYPKRNSFLTCDQELAEIGEFCGKLKAGLDARVDDQFCIVARVEALIAGHSMKEALHRANSYEEAGADAILIHSKADDANEVVEFANRWEGLVPLVVVPTKYHRTPTSVFEQAGISTVIWANHCMRAAVKAMQDVSRKIFEEKSIASLEGKIAPVSEIFRLTGENNFAMEEAKYSFFDGPLASESEINLSARKQKSVLS